MIHFPSPAKLNLFLYITGQRDDGYHNLQTLFQFLDFGDTMTFSPRQTDNLIRLVTPMPNVPDEQNLILRAAKMLQQHANCPYGVDISIDKRIPMGGGLGGASSNAATTLLALNYLWQCHVSQDDLMKMGRQLGADVPIFLLGHAAFAEGIGDELQLASPPEKWYLVAKPDIHISTVDVFKDPELKRNSPIRSLSERLNSTYSNDCEEIVRKRFDGVEYLITWLLQYAPTRLTGTGACVFAEFDDEQTAKNVQNRLPEGVQSFVSKGKNTSPLQALLTTLTDIKPIYS